jgi:hypothetical protein
MRRFSIATLMAVVLVCGVAVAALRHASDTWAGVMLALTLFMLGIALLGILTLRDARRAFWQGFALFGWGYLALTTGPWAAEQVGPRLPTTHLLGYSFGRLYPEPGVIIDSPVIVSSPASSVKTHIEIAADRGIVFIAAGGNLDQFVRVGHCLFALLAALVGGLIARWFHRTDREAVA